MKKYITKFKCNGSHVSLSGDGEDKTGYYMGPHGMVRIHVGKCPQNDVPKENWPFHTWLSTQFNGTYIEWHYQSTFSDAGLKLICSKLLKEIQK